MNNLSNLSIPELISKFQATSSKSWKTQYLNELKHRKEEVRGYFYSLSMTEEQKIRPLIDLIL